jgi:hypothetical protein
MFTFGVCDEVYKAGITEDGEDDIRTRYYVQATNKYGEVYFYTLKVWDNFNAAEKVANSISYRVGKDWAPSAQYWKFVRYEYGSDAYMDNYRSAEMNLMEDEEKSYHLR